MAGSGISRLRADATTRTPATVQVGEMIIGPWRETICRCTLGLGEMALDLAD